jgi:hypothetical protein
MPDVGLAATVPCAFAPLGSTEHDAANSIERKVVLVRSRGARIVNPPCRQSAKPLPASQQDRLRADHIEFRRDLRLPKNP